MSPNPVASMSAVESDHLAEIRGRLRYAVDQV